MQLAPRDGDELLSDQWKMRLHGTVNPDAKSLEFSFHFDAPEFNKYGDYIHSLIIRIICCINYYIFIVILYYIVGATLLRYHVNLKTNKVEMDSFVVSQQLSIDKINRGQKKGQKKLTISSAKLGLLKTYTYIIICFQLVHFYFESAKMLYLLYLQYILTSNNLSCQTSHAMRNPPM
jgi:hypothetical protein